MTKWLLGFVGATGVFCIIVFIWYNNQISRPLVFDENTLFEVRAGDSSSKTMIKLLAESRNEVDPLVGKIWLRLHLDNAPIKKGVYELAEEMTLTDIFSKLQHGKEAQFSLTLIEGQTWQQWLAYIQTKPFIIDDWTPEKSAQLLGHLTTKHNMTAGSWEGLLLAETYAYSANTKISEIVVRAFDLMLSTLETTQSAWPLPAPVQSRYDALILASIVEKETAQPEERPLIAGVFLNRLEQNMRLQTDPTVIYGIGDTFDGNITRAHLRQETPYNTYVIKGLPPTPIAMVGEAAIKSVFQATPTEYLYFVSKGDGTHQFSTNLEDHNRAVRKYQLGIDE